MTPRPPHSDTIMRTDYRLVSESHPFSHSTACPILARDVPAGQLRSVPLPSVHLPDGSMPRICHGARHGASRSPYHRRRRLVSSQHAYSSSSPVLPLYLLIISFSTFGGTRSYRSRFIAYDARPFVAERSAETYWNMLARGTLARTTFMLPRSASSATMPRLLLMSPMTSPMYSSGVVTSTFIIGSISLAPASLSPLRAACRPAISKAMTEESTSWYEPSTKVALQPMTGKPASTPLDMMDSRPLATPGMYSLGTAPPLISWSNMKPEVAPSSDSASSGSNLTTILANWPEPPDCFLWVYSTVAVRVMAS